MADQLLFEQSNESQVTSEPFISRQVVYVIDQNNGNYSGQIQLDTSSLSNSGKYASYSEAYLQVPLVLTMTSDNAAFDTHAPFAVGLKNGFYQLIHSVSVEYNNTNVIQLTPYSNFEVNYRLMTSLSDEDVKKFGPTIGFAPDSSTTYSYQQGVVPGTAGTTVVSGTGVLNNRNYETGVYPVARWAAHQDAKPNKGFAERQQTTSFEFTAPSSLFLGEDGGKAVGKDYYDHPAGTNDHVWYILATIRLKDMHDFFDKMPLVKGAYLRFIINVNTCQHTLTFVKQANTAGGAGSVKMSQESATITANGSSPILIASGEDNQGLRPIFTSIRNINTAGGAAAVVNATISLDIGKKTIGARTYPHPAWGAQTRLYVPLYQMNPVNEEQYLSLNRTKKIVYRDIYQYRTDVAAGQPFNALLTNGIPNPKTVLCIPFLRGTANPLNGAADGVFTDPFLSPFASEPGTTSPLIAFKDFNIQVAGVNMFIQNELYDFEQFQNELAPQNAINGGLVDGLTSGLISKTDFQHMYRYYVCDVSRRLPAEDKVPKSVQIIGKNQSAADISIFTYICYERECEVDLATGQKLS